MNHNEFDYDHDLIIPFKDFLRRHTAFKTNEVTDLILPSSYFELPLYISEQLNKNKEKSMNRGCFANCFGGENPENNNNENENDTSKAKFLN